MRREAQHAACVRACVSVYIWGRGRLSHVFPCMRLVSPLLLRCCTADPIHACPHEKQNLNMFDIDHAAAESINLTKTVHALLQVGEEVAELMRKAARELDVPASYHHHHQQQGAK